MATGNAYTQANRPLAVTTPIGADALLLERFDGVEALSLPFRFDLRMLAEAGTNIPFDRLLGGEVTVRVDDSKGGHRYFSGIIGRFTRGGRVPGPQGSESFIRYRAEVVPRFWLLSMQARSRIFQQLSVPDILKQVLVGFPVEYKLSGTYDPREFCVQYRESDFAFASRLMEDEGISYCFSHSESGHTMLVVDSAQGFSQVDPATVPFDEVEGGTRQEDRVRFWEKSQEIRPGKVTLRDHHFQTPDSDLQASKPTLSSVSAGQVDHPLGVANNGDLELYDYPGGYARRFDGIGPGGSEQSSDLQKVFTDNDRTAALRMEEQTSEALSISGSGDCRRFSAGTRFTLDGHADSNGDYLLTRVEHRADLGDQYTHGTAPPTFYTNTFRCIPAALPFRPRRDTPRPRVEGSQTAVVVGPNGQEIFTDKYGRVKVQFFWDRDGKNDASSSCWVRVGSPWAGSQWGMVHIPRIGQEVIVHFLEGDPDQPIIVGSVYNAANMPPYTLPDNPTQSGLKTRSTLQGTADTFNELRFEDKKDEEQIYFHAEKDFQRVVENNDSLKVGFDKKDKGDRTIEVFNNESHTVGAGEDQADDGSRTTSIYKDDTLTVETGNRSATVKKGDDSLTVSEGDRSATISQGDDTLEVSQGKRTTTINGDDSLTIKTGNLAVKVSAGQVSMEAAQQIELKVGGSTVTIGPASIALKSGANSVEIGPAGVTIKGTMLTLEGQATTSLKGAMTQVNGSGMVQVQGGVVMIN